MADDTLFSYFKSLPTPEDLERWEEEHARMGAAIKELTEKREQLGKLIQVAAEIYGGKEAIRRGVGGTDKRRGPQKGTWMSAIMEIAKDHPNGISYDDLRKALPEPFASTIVKDPHAKAFYGAMRRLENEMKVAVRHKSHFFTLEAFETYQKRAALGEIAEVRGRDTRGSPLIDELKRFLADNPRSGSGSIKNHLIRFPAFRTSILRNSSAIYNVLKRLKDREEIVRHEDGSYSLALENGAPDGDAAGAPEDGRAATLPFENVVGFPRPR
jgi:hypothetical protein